ncbi:MAG: PKD domain-containing protein [Thermoplasmata archaeon]|nr:MAG: PKD domain-containing protein [Thermoplasmata archaeon]
MPRKMEISLEGNRILTVLIISMMIISGILSFVSQEIKIDDNAIDFHNNEDETENSLQMSTEWLSPQEKTRNGDEEYLKLIHEIGYGTDIGDENSITSADVDNDGMNEIIFGNHEGYIHIIQYLDGEYVDVWKSPNLGSYIPALTTCDTDGDEIVEIVVGTGSGDLIIFGYQPGNGSYMQEWADFLFAFDVVGLAADDVDNDGFVEIVTGSSSFAEIPLPNVHVFGYDGDTYELEWLYWAEDSYYNHARTVAIGDVDNDWTKEFVVGISEFKYATTTPRGSFYVFGYNNGIYTVEWKRDDNSVDVIDIDVGDVDSDGFEEIVVGSGTANIYGYDSGAYHIENVIQDYFANVEVGNVNNDDTIEIVTGSGYSIRVWQEDTQIWQSEAYSLDVNGIEINDCDVDMTCEIILGMGDPFTQSGVVIIGFDGFDFQEEWEGKYISIVYSVGIDDVDNDLKNEILLGMDYGNIFVFVFENGEYSLKDNISLPSDYDVRYILCCDFEGDGTNEIAVIMPFDIFFIRYVNGNFEMIDYLEIVNGAVTAADVQDVDSDDNPEIIIGDDMGFLYIIGFDGSSFCIKWESQIYNTAVTALGVGNTDSDGIIEIVLGGYDTDIIFTEYIIYILGKEGNDYIEEWSQIADSTIYAVDVGDSDNDGVNEFTFMEGSLDLYIYGWDGTSYTSEWSTSDFFGIYDDCIDISEIEISGENKLIIGEDELYVIKYGMTYEYQWQTDTIDTDIECISVGDTDSHGSSEIVVSIGAYIFIYGKEIRPTASLSAKTTAYVGEEIVFDGSSSKGVGTLEYFFDFGDGSDTGWITEPIVTHSYSNTGTYIASLIVRDENGIESINPTDISITVIKPNIAPTASIDVITPNPATEGETVSFTGHGGDEDGYITAYLWESNINGYLNDSASFSISTLSVGTHTIFFKVRDDKETWSGSDNKTLVIDPKAPDQNQVPKAYIDSISPSRAEEGVTINFTGHGIDDDGIIISYYWESDIDGTLSDKETFSTSSLSVGTHTILFRVKDDNDAWSEPDDATLIIDPIPQNQAPIAYIDNVGPNPATEGDTVTFEGYGVDNDGLIISYSWESDIDGILSPERSFSTSSLSVGEHEITFKVQDDKEMWSQSESITLVVNEKDGKEPTNGWEIGDFILTMILLIILPVSIILVIIAYTFSKKRSEGSSEVTDCPNCGSFFTVTSSIRPLAVQCPICNQSTVLSD